MNGLKFIRIRSNLSNNELADILGVSRQAVCAWENDKKIPPKRLIQLVDFFGVDEKYFNKLSDSDIELLLNKKMFRVSVEGKEMYRYKPCSEAVDDGYFIAENREITLDNEYYLVKKRKKETLNKIDDIIQKTNSEYLIDRINTINRNCDMYDITTELLENIQYQDIIVKVPLYLELMSVYKVMLSVYDSNKKDDLELLLQEVSEKDSEWLLELQNLLSSHWQKTIDFWTNSNK